jgi:hypothetical protein
MVRQRPAAVLVMAILNLVFGGLHLLVYVCAGCTMGVMYQFANMAPPAAPPGQPNVNSIYGSMFQELGKLPGYWAFMIASNVLGILLATLLIVAGIGLLKMRPWSRTLCVVYVFGMFLFQIANVYYGMVYVNPAMARWQENLMRQQPQAVPPGFAPNATFSNLGTIVGAGFFMAYSVALMVVLFLPSVSAAFAGKTAPPAEEPEDYYDEPGGSEQITR